MNRGTVPILFLACFACESSDSKPGRDASRADSGEADAAIHVDAARPDSGQPDAGGPDAGDAGSDAASMRTDASEQSDASDGLDAGDAPVRIQIFSRTAGFRHDIDTPRAVLVSIAARRGAMIHSTEDPAVLISRLSESDVVVFLMTTGDVLDDSQQPQFEAYIRGGGGFVGIHSAADTEYDWPFYGELIGAWFKGHPAVQPAKIIVEATDDPLVSFLPREWMRSDEWYNYRRNPRPDVKVLLRLDESTYTGGDMGADHPIAWSRTIGQGRAFYTGLGHTSESWAEPLVVRHVEEAVFWAARR